jgi:hypothetical protein
MAWRLLALTLIAAISAAVAGCAATAREMARQAAPPAAESGLVSLNRPEDQKAIDDLSHSTGIRRVGQSVGLGVGQGIVDRFATLAGLPVPADPSDAEMSNAQTQASAATTQGAAATQPATLPSGIDIGRPIANVFGSVGAGINRDLRPALAATVRDAVNEGMQAGLGPETQARASELASAICDAVMRKLSRQVHDDLGPALASAVREQVGPAVGDVIRQQVAPAARQLTRDGIRGALEGAADATHLANGSSVPLDEQVARQVSEGATLGVDDAAKQAGFNAAGLPVRDLAGTLDKLIWVATGLLVVAGLLAVALILAVLLLAWAVWKSRPKAAGAATS